MATARNAPCPFGSGKKYKKCCLARDEAEARAQTAEAALEAEREEARRQWDAARADDARPEPDREDEDQRSSGPDWPALSPEDQRVADAWWDEVRPVYLGTQQAERCGWLLERTLAFLNEQPRLGSTQPTKRWWPAPSRPPARTPGPHFHTLSNAAPPMSARKSTPPAGPAPAQS